MAWEVYDRAQAGVEHLITLHLAEVSWQSLRGPLCAWLSDQPTPHGRCGVCASMLQDVPSLSWHCSEHGVATQTSIMSGILLIGLHVGI